MGKIIGILISSLIFFFIFKFFGLTAKAAGGPECGFFYGIAHGYIAIPSAIVKLIINKGQSVYAPVNTGLGYGIGFVIGLFFLGGTGFLGKSRRRTND